MAKKKNQPSTEEMAEDLIQEDSVSEVEFLSDEGPTLYTNQVHIGHSPHEIFMSFRLLRRDIEGHTTSREMGRVLMSTRLAKELLPILAAQIAKWQESFAPGQERSEPTLVFGPPAEEDSSEE